MNTVMTRVLVAPAILLAAFGLAGCANPQPESTATDAAFVQESDLLAISDAWVKATDTEMTGSFGTLTNKSDADITIVSATTEVAGMTELHETIVQSDGSSVMQEIDGGFVVPAGEDLVLEPGGNHVMLMGLNTEILPGDEVTITLATGDGEEFEYVATAREYTGAQETYAPDGSMQGGGAGGSGGEMDHDMDQNQTQDQDMVHQDNE
ncbi:copper chaperone PCu(A)C [Gulosibacter molinativorax]|nr:copper chaperone PCu(A)C [Gulosibacter molinativorax]QUY62446.1 Copper metallochaperone [Gulosibacter molinativorax]